MLLRTNGNDEPPANRQLLLENIWHHRSVGMAPEMNETKEESVLTGRLRRTRTIGSVVAVPLFLIACLAGVNLNRVGMSGYQLNMDQ